jgi:predicted Zn-dependent peptidase
MLPRLFLAFRAPTFGTDDHYAGSVVGAILGMGKGSKLQRHLVRERQVAAEATAFTFDLAKGADLLVVDVTARPEIGGEQLEREVAQEIDRLRREGVSATDLERALALIESALVTSLQSAGERADKLSMFATFFGDPSRINAEPQRYRAVTVERVNRFIQERLGEDNRASLLYVPNNEGGGRREEGGELESVPAGVES